MNNINVFTPENMAKLNDVKNNIIKEQQPKKAPFNHAELRHDNICIVALNAETREKSEDELCSMILNTIFNKLDYVNHQLACEKIDFVAELGKID